MLIRLVVALFRLRRLEVESREAIVSGVPVLISEQVKTPLTWGIRRSVILLPASLISGDLAVRESALRHEQAHIARWDWMWNVLAEVVCALYWFQPGAWWLRSRLRSESERACDDRVLLSGIAAPDYAAHLLAIVRSVCTTEVAPAMDRGRGMEERMRHILDAKKPRRAKTVWLAVSAPVAVVLLMLSALRVSAKPAGAETDAERVNSRSRSGSSTVLPRPTNTRVPSADFSTPHMSELPQPALPLSFPDRAKASLGDYGTSLKRSTHDLPRHSAPQDKLPQAVPLPLREIVWGKAVDGLQPGFWLTQPSLPNTHKIPVNSLVTYRVLVRNTTNKSIEFMVQVVPYEGFDAPYLIPNDSIGEALDGREVPEKFRAKCAPHNLAGVDAAYVVSLAPGEAVLLYPVPGPYGLFLGDADREGYPSIAKFKVGMNWIVQPVTIHSLTPAETADARASEMRVNLTIASHDGTASQRSVALLPARNGGKRLYAKMQVDVKAVGATSVRGASKPISGEIEFRVADDWIEPVKQDGISWGEESERYRYGLRIADSGGMLEIWVQNRANDAQVLRKPIWPPDVSGTFDVRDNGEIRMRVPVPGISQESRLEEKTLRPGEKVRLYTRAMRELLGDPISGGYMLKPLYKPGFRPMPGESFQPMPGETYTIEWSSGVHRTGRISFRAPVQNAVSWGPEQRGLRLGIRLPSGADHLSDLVQAKFEVLLSNRSGRRMKCSWVGSPINEQTSPDILIAAGKPLRFEHMTAGPYLARETSLASGETVVLGTTSLPNARQNLPVTLGSESQDEYNAEFELAVTLPDHERESLKSRLSFTVAPSRW